MVTPVRKLTGNKFDEAGAPQVAIVNESLVKKYFPHQSPLGVRFSRSKDFKMESSLEIIGVVKDAMYFGVREKTEPMIYIPLWHDGAGGRSLCVRTVGNPERLTGAIRREAALLDAAIPVQQTADARGSVPITTSRRNAC